MCIFTTLPLIMWWNYEWEYMIWLTTASQNNEISLKGFLVARRAVESLFNEFCALLNYVWKNGCRWISILIYEAWMCLHYHEFYQFCKHKSLLFFMHLMGLWALGTSLQKYKQHHVPCKNWTPKNKKVIVVLWYHSYFSSNLW